MLRLGILLVCCFILPAHFIFNKSAAPHEVHLGIIDRAGKHRNAFTFAIEFVETLDILSRTKIVPYYRDVTSSPIIISKRVFELMQRGVTAIICLAPSSTTEIVASFANEKNIPVIAVTATDPLLENKEKRPFLLRISPSDFQQSAAISDILAHFNWFHFSVLTSYDSYGIHGIAGIQEAATARNWKVNNIQHFTVPDDLAHFNVSKELDIIWRSESRIIVLNCGASAAGLVLRQAERFGLTSPGYAWVVSDGVVGNFVYLSNRIMKLHARRKERNELFASTGYNKFDRYLDGLIGTTPASKNGVMYRWFTEEFSDKYSIKRRDITPFTRLAFDSVYVFAQGLHNYLNDDNPLIELNINVWDEPGTTFSYGPLIYQYLANVKINGTSKKELSFDANGEIKNANYDIVNFNTANGYFKEVGSWSPEAGITMDPDTEVYFSGGTHRVPSYQIADLQGRHLILGVDVDPPFVQQDEKCGNTSECYSGYCIRLVQELSRELKFTYEFRRPSDGTWGGLHDDGTTWTGIFKDLLDRKIDVATVHMSINSIREKIIDFSVPFMQAGLTVVVKGEEETSDGLFFLSPFSADVLYAIGAAVIAVVVIVWVYNRISPNGLYWSKQYALMSCKCSMCRRRRREGRQFQRHKTCALKELEAKEELFDQLNMTNSTWIVVASLLNQDPVISWPTSIPGRIVLLFWWLVVMVVLAMYTANLAAFLTITKMTTGISKIEDLLTQDRYTWGTVKGTHPEVALSNSVRDDFKDIIRKQNAVASTDEGFAKVLTHEYAFIYESPIFEYMKRKYCSIEKVGAGEFLSFDYAFGFPPDSPYIDVINRALLKLQENSLLDKIWNEILAQTGQCPPRPPSAQLTLQSLDGVFTTLAMGLIASVLALVGEYGYVTWSDVHGRTVGCPPNERPKTMFEALKRRLCLLLHDLRHSFSPISSTTKKFSVNLHDASIALKDLEKFDIQKRMLKLSKCRLGLKNGCKKAMTNIDNTSSPIPDCNINNKGEHINNDEVDRSDSDVDSNVELDVYSQLGDECAECGH